MRLRFHDRNTLHCIQKAFTCGNKFEPSNADVFHLVVSTAGLTPPCFNWMRASADVSNRQWELPIFAMMVASSTPTFG
jgi:hypothetical protein